jgi:Zn-dependent peptidase ImmA (M78 family)
MKKINKFGVMHLSTSDIESKAEEVIRFFDPSILETLKQVPIIDFVEQLHNKYNVTRDYSIDLGSTKYKHKILGRTTISPLGIFIDISLKNDSRFPFTVAHELGHLVLHRKVKFKESGYSEQEMVDTEYNIITNKKILRTPRDWIEWQANRFASAILMPRIPIYAAIIAMQLDMGINRNIGHIILENEDYSIKDYSSISDKLQQIYGVNHTNIEYRLKDLDILIDRRNIDLEITAEFFKSE